MSDSAVPRLIEIALPIREISAESVRDKSLRHGHISTLHLWWARRPLAAARAVVFAALVPDPDHPACPPEFRAAVLRLLKERVPDLLKSCGQGRKARRDPDPYRPCEGIPDTPRNRLLAFIARWSPGWVAFEKGKNGKEPPPGEMLDDRCLVKWETGDPRSERGRAVLSIARELVCIANGGDSPTLLDPFAGGGAIPLEAARLGCRAIANDYNPVAYLILRATCEFPQKYGSRCAGDGGQKSENPRLLAAGDETAYRTPPLQADVERWAKRILERARARIGHLYPPGSDGRPVVGYLWARTAPCSNPACRATIPLLRSLLVCNKPGKRVALTMNMIPRPPSLEVPSTLAGPATPPFPLREGGPGGLGLQFSLSRNKFIARTEGTMLSGGDCRCPFCHQTTPVEDLRRAGLEGRMGERMVAVITDTPQGKDYRPVEPSDLLAFKEARCLAEAVERPGEEIPQNQWNIKTWLYGMKTWGSLFNPRQLLAMQTFTACLRDALTELERDEPDAEYRKAVGVYLGLWVSRNAMRMATIGRWDNVGEKFQTPFDAQAIPMKWDYPEANPFSDVTGGFSNQLDWISYFLAHESPPFDMPALKHGHVSCRDGAHLPFRDAIVDIVTTDPPYFDSIAYADLSDFFYIWLKRGIGDVFPEAFATPLTPKSDEATALKHRHDGNAGKAKEHFTSKLAACLAEARRVCRPDGVIAVMFAHQSTEAWTALINALFEAGLNVTATYPIDTELKNRAIALGTSALESSITVVCRPREAGAAGAFREVRREIERVVAESVHRFFEYGFRGADLIVACYGPAVGVFGRYEWVERADGTPVTVPELLKLAREAALKAIAGEFTGDALSRLYFVWANLYGISEQAWDDARLVVQVGGESTDAMDLARRHDLFVVEGSACRLALLKDRAGRRHFGEDSSSLIDMLHRAMLFWKEERRSDLTAYLRDRGLTDHAPFWKLAQALFEVLPRAEEDWKLVSALLGERETLKIEALRTLPPKERTLFDQ